jgi:hypothetical protein
VRVQERFSKGAYKRCNERHQKKRKEKEPLIFLNKETMLSSSKGNRAQRRVNKMTPHDHTSTSVPAYSLFCLFVFFFFFLKTENRNRKGWRTYLPEITSGAA